MNDSVAAIVASILAGLSLLVAAISLWVSLANYRRDTSKLKVNVTSSLSLYEPPTITLEVVNVGHRPTTIVEAGFKVNQLLTLQPLDNKGAKKGKTMDEAVININAVGTPTVLPAGEIKRFIFVLKQWPNLLTHADSPLLPFVRDLSGKSYDGEQSTYLRQLLNGGWVPPANTPQSLLEPFEGERRPIKPESKRTALKARMKKLWKKMI